MILLVLAACTAPPSAEDTGVPGDSEALPLEVRFLAVGGLAFQHGEDLVLTAPMYTNPGFFDVTLGEIASDPSVVEAFLPPEWVQGAGAILVGHAHYDHLLDVAHVQAMSGGAPVYGNRTVRNLVPGLDVVVLNDPADPLVDTRMCPPDPCTGVTGEGDWVYLAGANARIRALCSSHPAQFVGTYHFAEGCVDTPVDAPPVKAADWLEGATLAYLVDFLDADGEPVHRVYYQDAPTSAPIGHVHPDLLAEKAVDLAVLNVGSYDAVADQPAEILEALDPRYALGVHWEDFFRTLDQPVQPIPFHAAPEVFDAVAFDALAPGEEPVLVDGEFSDGRYWRPMPGTPFEFPQEP